MLGGDGSDRIEGRAGDDIIDGDAWLHVDLTRDAQGNIFAGSEIIREIRYDLTDGDVDTAVYQRRAGELHHQRRAGRAGLLHRHPNRGDAGHRSEHRPTTASTASATSNACNSPIGTFTRRPCSVAARAEREPGADRRADHRQYARRSADVLTVTSTLRLRSDGRGLVDHRRQHRSPDADGIVDGRCTINGSTSRSRAGRRRSTWVDIAGATSANFTATSFVTRQRAPRATAYYVDGLGFTEHVFSALTALVAPNAGGQHRAVHHCSRQNPPGLPDTSARTNTPINLVLPLTSVFADNQTATDNLLFSATLANGAALDGSVAAMACLQRAPDSTPAASSYGLITGQSIDRHRPDQHPRHRHRYRHPARRCRSPTPSSSTCCRAIARRSRRVRAVQRLAKATAFGGADTFSARSRVPIPTARPFAFRLVGRLGVRRNGDGVQPDHGRVHLRG